MSQSYGYTGEWYEGYIGLLHLRARWLMPYLNQFISPDPIIPDYFNPQSLNRYSYVLNNPVNLTDPTGLTPNCQNSKCKVELGSSWTFDLVPMGLDFTVNIEAPADTEILSVNHKSALIR